MDRLERTSFYEAEHFIAECLADEPEWVDVLSVVEVDFEFVPN